MLPQNTISIDVTYVNGFLEASNKCAEAIRKEKQRQLFTISYISRHRYIGKSSLVGTDKGRVYYRVYLEEKEQYRRGTSAK